MPREDVKEGNTREVMRTEEVVYMSLYSVKKDGSNIPLTQTSSSQKFMESLMGNCTMTYLAGGRSVPLHCRLTVAPAGTAPGY